MRTRPNAGDHARRTRKNRRRLAFLQIQKNSTVKQEATPEPGKSDLNQRA